MRGGTGAVVVAVGTHVGTHVVVFVETGLRYMIGIFGVATTYQLMSVLMNEMPMVVVSSHPNR